MIEFLGVPWALGILMALIVCSAFFSGSETSMMSINRYRLRHLAKHSKRAATTQRMLKRPDRLLGIILIGNTFANICASALATLLAVYFFGESLGVTLSTFGLTFILLIFAEVMPKTVAALHPQPFALAVTYPLWLLSKVLSPLVWIVNSISNSMIALFGGRVDTTPSLALSQDELKTLVHDSHHSRPSKPQHMLLKVLELEAVSVEDIMVPLSDVFALNLSEPFDKVLKNLQRCHYTLLPVHGGMPNEILGYLHLRDVFHRSQEAHFTPETLRQMIRPAYFVPNSTQLSQQLLQFQQHKQRLAFVVNEYGDLQGLVTLSDLLEEIVGNFTTDVADVHRLIHPQKDGSYWVSGSITIREFNRLMPWALPTDGPKTLSGLIIEHLEHIPENPLSLCIQNLPIEVMPSHKNRIKTAKISPPLRPMDEALSSSDMD